MFSNLIFAQINVPNNPYQNGGAFSNEDTLLNKQWGEDDSLDVDLDIIDESIYYINIYNIEDTASYTDTALVNNFFEYDPQRKEHPFQYNLGYSGSQGGSYIYENDKSIDFGFGHNIGRQYFKKREDLNFLISKNAYTELHFNQGGQSDLMMDARFSKTYKNTTLYLDYFRISHKPSDDYVINKSAVYTDGQIEMDALQAGIGYLSPNKKYNFFFNYLFNQSIQSDNGGYVRTDQQDSLLLEGQNLDNPFDLAISLLNPRTRLSDFSFNLLQHYQLGKVTDSTINNLPLVSLNTTYRKEVYHNYNEFSTTSFYDSTYYTGNITDDRGVRLYFSQKALDNELSIKVTGKNIPSNTISVGLQHQLINWNNIPDIRKNNFLWLTALVHQTIKDKWLLDADFRLGVLGRVGNYELNGVASWLNFIDGIDIILDLNQKLRSPYLVEEKLYNTQILLWENNLRNELTTNLGGSLRFNKWNSTISLRNINVDNFIYFDENKRVAQADNINIVQFFAKNKLKFFKSFHFDNQVFVQQISDTDILPLPNWGVESRFYYKSKWFDEKLHLQIGLRGQLYESFQPYAYDGLSEQFYLQRAFTNPSLAKIDAFLMLRRDKFRFFLNLDNLFHFTTDKTLQYVDRYPTKDAYLRLGISWILYK